MMKKIILVVFCFLFYNYSYSQNTYTKKSVLSNSFRKNSKLLEKDSNFKVNPLVEDMFKTYVTAWSEQDFETISEEVYEIPFSLYLQDTTIIFNTKNEVISFLKKTFNELESNNYGHSITNNWEHYREDNGLIIVEMNFTRFLKDGTIMGLKERTATYVLRKSNNKFKINGMIPHTPVSK
jgi:hypothetical protein